MSKTKRASNDPKKAEPKVPTVADRIAQLEATVIRLNERINTQGVQKNKNFMDVCMRLVALESRLPAPAEPKEVAEWAKFTELQEGDACRVTEAEKKEIISMASDIGITNPSCYNHYRWLYYRTNGSVRITGTQSEPDPGRRNWREVPAEEWKRRLLGTIAARKKKAEEVELAKSIAFGTPVEYQDDKGWRIAADAPQADQWLITKKGTARLIWAFREDFKVLTD